jgi:hypothetical protein
LSGVVRDEEPELAEPLEFEERQVGCVWRYLTRRNPPPWCRQAGIAPCPHPPGPRKSGIPESVLMPAPVKATMCSDPAIHWAIIPMCRSRRRSSIIVFAAATRLLLPAALGFGTLHLPQAGRFHPALLDQLPHLAAVTLNTCSSAGAG